MSEDPATLEAAAARFVARFRAEDIDPETMKAVKSLIKDQFAVQLGAVRLPWSVKARAFRNPRPGRATIVGEATKAAAVDAAYLNATYGHGFEFDDLFDNGHPGSAIVPAAFALGEDLGATLGETLVALVAGYEAYVRIGRLGSPGIVRQGWQPHSVLSNYGVAAVAARLFGLGDEETLHAMAIAHSHAGGTMEYTTSGGSIKRLHAGMAVRNGIEAAGLARAGITGPRRFLTGARGLYRNFAGHPVEDDAQAIFAPDAPNLMPGQTFKPYSCCGAAFPYIEAMERFIGRGDEIAHVDARVQSMTNAIASVTDPKVYQPRNVEELQFSVPAQMALAVLGLGNGYRAHSAFLEGRMALDEESEVLRMARRMRLTHDAELDRYPYFVADVTVHFTDGSQEHVFEERSKGAPNKPYTAAEHRRKLDELTADLLTPEQAEALYAMIDEMRPDRPVAEVMAALAPAA